MLTDLPQLIVLQQVLEQLKNLREGALTDLHMADLQVGRRNIAQLSREAFKVVQSFRKLGHMVSLDLHGFGWSFLFSKAEGSIFLLWQITQVSRMSDCVQCRAKAAPTNKDFQGEWCITQENFM